MLKKHRLTGSNPHGLYHCHMDPVYFLRDVQDEENQTFNQAITDGPE
jgi:hypothetical protein